MNDKSTVTVSRNSWSQYFRSAFSNEWAEKRDGKFIFKKPNISPQLFNIILRFIYCGNIELKNLQGATIWVAKIKDSTQIIGGYNPLDWDEVSYWKTTGDSFIFNFTDGKNISTSKVSYVNNREYAVFCHDTYGPTMGNLHCNLNGWSNVNRGDGDRYPNIGIPENNFKVEYYEVFQTGPLNYDINEKEWIKVSYDKVVLRYLYDLQNITDGLINKIESYLGKYFSYGIGISQNPDTKVYILLLREVESSSSYEKYNYGISQNPDTKAYILVFNIGYLDLYCDDCGGKYEEVDGEGIAIWKKDPLHFNGIKKKVISESYEKVCLKYLHNSQDVTDEFLNEIESYLAIKLIFGISQNPVTKVYNLVLNEKGNFATAMWKDGRLYYSRIRRKYKRILNEKVLLKYLDNSQNINYTFLNKIAYSINESYGISQNPNTKDFIFVLQPRYYCENCGEKYNNKFEVDNKSCASCQTNHENQKINDLIQEMKLSKGGFSTVYSAIWEDGLLIYDGSTWKRKSNTMVALKCLHNSQNFLDEFINEVRAYPNQKIENILKIYGISQNLNTKNYKIDDISDMSIYGVMPYVAPEVLKGKPYTQAADIYSFVEITDFTNL
ncbi:hypothetical protein GLOIN_2v275216 [Rhizophagus irregularis DAOM 181602=DAOM 197198]|nr:hypothetical protein GLOIN_2v275216 [Rhizophagus irregularis DAOM 181602=DAOM 197198]